MMTKDDLSSAFSRSELCIVTTTPTEAFATPSSSSIIPLGRNRYRTTAFYGDISGRAKLTLGLRLHCSSEDDLRKIVESGCLMPAPEITESTFSNDTHNKKKKQKKTTDNETADDKDDDNNDEEEEEEEKEDAENFWRDELATIGETRGSRAEEAKKKEKPICLAALDFECKSVGGLHAGLSVEAVTILDCSIVEQFSETTNDNTNSSDATTSTTSNAANADEGDVGAALDFKVEILMRAPPPPSASLLPLPLLQQQSPFARPWKGLDVEEAKDLHQPHEKTFRLELRMLLSQPDGSVTVAHSSSSIMPQSNNPVTSTFDVTMVDETALGLLSLELGAGSVLPPPPPRSPDDVLTGREYKIHHGTESRYSNSAILELNIVEALSITVREVGGARAAMGATLVSLTMAHSNQHDDIITITNIALHPGHSRLWNPNAAAMAAAAAASAAASRSSSLSHHANTTAHTPTASNTLQQHHQSSPMLSSKSQQQQQTALSSSSDEKTGATVASTTTPGTLTTAQSRQALMTQHQLLQKHVQQMQTSQHHHHHQPAPPRHILSQRHSSLSSTTSATGSAVVGSNNSNNNNAMGTSFSQSYPPEGKSMQGSGPTVLDMSRHVRWGYAQGTEPNLPLRLSMNEAFATVIEIDAGENSKSGMYMSPITITAVVGSNNSSNTANTDDDRQASKTMEDEDANNRADVESITPVVVVSSADARWTTARLAVDDAADAFKIDMSLLGEPRCTVGAPVIVGLKVTNLSNETKDLMLLMAKDEESNKDKDIYSLSDAALSRSYHQQFMAQKNLLNNTTNNSNNNLTIAELPGRALPVARPSYRQSSSQSQPPQSSRQPQSQQPSQQQQQQQSDGTSHHGVNTAVVSEVNGYTFGVWGLSGDDDGTTRHNRDHELLAVDAALLLGEVRGQHTVEAELRFVPLREGTLDVPNLKLYDKLGGRWYNCVHLLKIVAADKKG